jgi:hypothetical protein
VLDELEKAVREAGSDAPVVIDEPEAGSDAP